MLMMATAAAITVSAINNAEPGILFCVGCCHVKSTTSGASTCSNNVFPNTAQSRWLYLLIHWRLAGVPISIWRLADVPISDWRLAGVPKSDGVLDSLLAEVGTSCLLSRLALAGLVAWELLLHWRHVGVPKSGGALDSLVPEVGAPRLLSALPDLVAL
jgi:hypothetical protein